ncbi:MAG TPA: hypothetical protein VIM37_00190 [Candidatus Microsaccharimonas sp.]|jgi:hypothetical protein
MKSTKARIAAIGIVSAAAIALAVVGASTTSAYLSDTVNGSINGTIGTIQITSANSALNYDRLLPGTPQTVTANYQNTGNSPQDVWVVFNDADALHAMNDKGTYAEFHISANGVHLFDSANLNDGLSTGCVTSVNGCWPLPRAVKLVSNLAPNASGNVSFTFGYASKMTTPETAFNAYPVASLANPHATPTSSGMPYELVAVQHGQTP